jgi:multicomponent K+:H+ antiporter subunit A
VLLLLGLRWLPKRFELPGTARPGLITTTRRGRDLTLALVAGAGMCALAFGVMTRLPSEPLGQHFLERAYAEGGGTNVVNVILVDFRGFDTLGEITVLAAVALVVFALLRRFRPAPDSLQIPEQQDQNARTATGSDRRAAGKIADWLLIPSVLARLLFPVTGLVALFLLLRGHDPVTGLVALFLLLRGHDLPGGGFVAGLTVAIGIITLYMTGGAQWVEARLHVRPLAWMGVGLLLSTGTGTAAWLFGAPFLTSYFAYAKLPIAGKVPLSSALAFDIGVFALVVGATVLMLIALAHQSVRGHRAAVRDTDPPDAIR